MTARGDRKERKRSRAPRSEEPRERDDAQGDLLSDTGSESPGRGSSGPGVRASDSGAPADREDERSERASGEQGALDVESSPSAPGPEDGDGPDEGEPVDDGDGGSGADRGADLRDPADIELERARELVAEGRIDEATEAYRSLVSRHPHHLRARNDLGVLFDELGQHALALEQFQAARDLQPENVEVLANVGAALGDVGRFDDAERELRRAQRLDPDSIEVRARLGILYFRRGLYAQAENELRWVCIRDNSHGPAHFYRGEALNRLGRVDDAMEALERAANLQPDNARAFYTLGILFDKKHMPQEAARMYRRAREIGRS